MLMKLEVFEVVFQAWWVVPTLCCSPKLAWFATALMLINVYILKSHNNHVR